MSTSTDSSWAHARCVDLLNAASLGADPQEIARAVKEVTELASAHASANDGATFADVIDSVLEFRASSSVAVRTQTIEACETLALKKEDAIAACADAVRGMLRDESAGCGKRAARACGVIGREALILAAVKGNAGRVLKHVQNAWNAGNRMNEDLGEVLCAIGVNDGVRMACAKTLEASILALAGEGWGSNVVKVGHKTLNLEEMMGDAVRLAERLHEALRGVSEGAKPTGPLALVLVAALGNLCVKKAELATGCTPALIEYAKAHVAREKEDVAVNGRASGTNASVSKELKTVLLDVLRNGPTQAVEGGMMNELSTICRELGAGDAVDSALRHRERTAHALGEKRASFLSPAGNLKRARMREREQLVPPPPPPIMPMAPMTDQNILQQILVTLAALASSPDRNMLDAFVMQLAPPALADAILANLEHLPQASQFYLASRSSAMRPPPPPPMVAAAAMVTAPEVEEAAEPLSVIVTVEALSEVVAEEFRLAAIQRMFAVGTMAEEYGGAEKLTLSGPLRSSLLARLAAAGAAKSSGATMEEETLAIASALLFTADGGGVYETEGVNMLTKWLTTLYAQDVAYEFSYIPYEHAISAAIECLTRGVAGATSTTAIASGAKKPLSQLLCDVPALPAFVWEAFRCMCRLKSALTDEDEGKFPKTDETVTLILSVLQDIILERPPARNKALELTCKLATEALSDEVVRGKAIRLIANRLHPVKHLAHDIESYAKEGLNRGRSMGAEALRDAKRLVEIEAAVKEEAEVEKDKDANAEKDAMETESAAGDETTIVRAEKVDHIAKACDLAVGPMLLYCSLCARNYALLPGLFEVYAALDDELRIALHRPVNGLARAVGPNCLDLCDIIASPPEGSLQLAVQCLNTLASIATIPAPPSLLAAAESLYESQNKDVAYLAPLVCSFDEERIRDLLPQFIHANGDIFSSVLDALLSVPEEQAKLSPVAIFIAVHEVQTGQSGVTLKQLVDACSTCFERPDVFTPQVLASAMQQMVEQTPLPLLFMRTVIQAETIAPQLKEFTLGLLRTLVNRQVWKMDKNIWEGFLRCAKRAAPRSFPLFTELPAPVLESVLAKFGDAFKDELSQYARNPSVANTIPRAIFALL